MLGKLTQERVILNQIVQSIDSTGGMVTVTTENGTIYRSNTVLITVSIGVL